MTISYRRPWLYDKQREALFNRKRFGVVEAATKTGKTTAAIAWLFERAACDATRCSEYWWVAPSTGQTRMAFTRLKRALPHGFCRARYSNPPALHLPNGTVIRFRTGEKPDLLYGDDVGGVVLDEYTRMREEAWFAVQSTLTATRGPARLIGNVRGSVGWGYRLARRAEAGDPDWHYARMTWRDGVAAGVIDPASVQMAERQMPEWVFQELYEARAADRDSHPIGLAAIARCATLDALPRTEPLVWGWDIGRHVSFTAGVGLDADGHVCRESHFKADWPTTVSRIVRETGSAMALVDATHGSVGDPIFTALQQRPGDARFVPFQFTASTREALFNELAVAIQEGDVRFRSDGVLRAELDAMEWQATMREVMKYGFPDGVTGDLAVALALAVWQHRRGQQDIAVWGGGEAGESEPSNALEEYVLKYGSYFPGDR